MPESGHPSPVDRLIEFEAVRLFVDRATAARPGFALTGRNAAAVVEICTRLDGIPLAIELAAARAKALAPEEIAPRLDQRFWLLTGGSRAALPRHRTLRALVDWSHDLLAAQERVLLRRLSVFAGGWTLGAAEAICACAGLQEDEIAPLLLQLVEKSLVFSDEQGGQARFRLLETIRQYGREKLREAGEEVLLRGRHMDWFLRLAEQAAPNLRGAEQARWFDRLDTEHENLRAALEWSKTVPDGIDTGVRLGDALARFWLLRGHVQEGRRRLGEFAGLAPDRSAARARALSAAGFLASYQGDYPAALSLLNDGLALWRELGDGRGLADALAGLGVVAQSRGDDEDAAALLGESAALFSHAGAESVRYGPLAFYLAELAAHRGDHGRALDLYEEALAICRERGDNHGVASSLRGLARLAPVQDDPERATALLRESLVLYEELGDRRCVPLTLEALACIACGQGQMERALRLFGAAEALLETSGAVLAPSLRADHDRRVAAARVCLGEQRFAAAWARGRAMPPEQAIRYALAAAERRRSDVTVSGGPRARGGAPILTRREREVVALIARGFTNRQIAIELVIAERTAERHVENILDKLALASRTQVATWALEHGLPRAPQD